MISSQAEAGRISLQTSIPEHPVEVFADETKIRQAVINIIGNAVKFSAEGGSVTVVLSAMEAQGSPHFLLLDASE
jgi:signal transduction histidine kinase